MIVITEKLWQWPNLSDLEEAQCQHGLQTLLGGVARGLQGGALPEFLETLPAQHQRATPAHCSEQITRQRNIPLIN